MTMLPVIGPTMGRGSDGEIYTIQPMRLDLVSCEMLWNRMTAAGIMSDDIEPTIGGFQRWILGSGALWFAVEHYMTHEQVGVMYIDNLIRGQGNEFFCANWHAMVWGARGGQMVPVAREGIRFIFKILKLHRLQAIVPMKFGGTIRLAQKIGFKPEGEIRQYIQFGGVWFNCLLLSILEGDEILSEVQDGHN